MDDQIIEARFVAIEKSIAITVGTLADLVGGLARACGNEGSLDPDKFASMLEDLASRPDVGKLDRGILERVLRLIS